MTSFTSYGRSVSLNFLLATRNFRILLEEGNLWQLLLFQQGTLFQSLLCPFVQIQVICLDHSKQPLLGPQPPYLTTRLPFALHTHRLDWCLSYACLYSLINRGGGEWTPCLSAQWDTELLEHQLLLSA